MGVSFSYQPPRVDAAALIHTAAKAAEKAVADEVLDQSQPLVPVEYGVLAASGRVVEDTTGTAVTYGRDDDGSAHHAPSNQYAVKQHEDLELHHPNGGQGKFLEQPFNQAEQLAPLAAAELRKAFGA